MRIADKLRVVNAPTRIIFVAFFTILLLFSTTVELTHAHQGGVAHSDCALCQSAHTVVQAKAPQCAPHVHLVSTRVVTPSKRVYREHTFSFSHWNKPPPDQPAIS